MNEEFILDLENEQTFDLVLDNEQSLDLELDQPVPNAFGTMNYNLLVHKPSIDGIELIGDIPFTDFLKPPVILEGNDAAWRVAQEAILNA